MAHWIVRLHKNVGDDYVCSNCGVKYNTAYSPSIRETTVCHSCGVVITDKPVYDSTEIADELYANQIKATEILSKMNEEENKANDAAKKLIELKNKHRQPGTFERYLNDICEYLCSKFPDKNVAEVQEVASYIAYRATVMATDLIMERDKSWEYVMRKQQGPKLKRRGEMNGI